MSIENVEKYQLQFKLEQKEITDAYFYIFVRSPLSWIVPIFIPILFFVITVSDTSRSVRYSALFVIISIVFILLVLLQILITYIYLKDVARKYNGESASLTIEDSAIFVTSLSSQGELKWTAFKKVRRIAKYILMDTTSGGMLLLPRRAFQSSSEMDNAFQFLQTRIDKT